MGGEPCSTTSPGDASGSDGMLPWRVTALLIAGASVGVWTAVAKALLALAA